MSELYLELTLYLSICFPHKQEKDPPLPSLWDDSFGCLLYNSVVAVLASSPKFRLFTLVHCYGTRMLSAEKRWECYQSCMKACSACPCTDSTTRHMRCCTMAIGTSKNYSYKAPYWAQGENLNANRIPFTIDSMLGPVYDCATETNLAYHCLGCMRIVLRPYLMHLSIYIAVLMSNTLDGQINMYLILPELSLWLNSWRWIDFQKQSCFYW